MVFKQGLLLLMLMMFSCAPSKRLDRIYTRHPELLHTDTIVTSRDSVVYVDSVVRVYVPGDTVYVSGEIFVGDTIRVQPELLQAETEFSKSTAWVTETTLNLELIDKDTTLFIRMDSLQREVFHWQNLYKNDKTIIEVRKTPKFYMVMSWVGVGIVFVLIALIVLKTLSKGKLL